MLGEGLAIDRFLILPGIPLPLVVVPYCSGPQ